MKKINKNEIKNKKQNITTSRKKLNIQTKI